MEKNNISVVWCVVVWCGVLYLFFNIYIFLRHNKIKVIRLCNIALEIVEMFISYFYLISKYFKQPYMYRTWYIYIFIYFEETRVQYIAVILGRCFITSRVHLYVNSYLAETRFPSFLFWLLLRYDVSTTSRDPDLTPLQFFIF